MVIDMAMDVDMGMGVDTDMDMDMNVDMNMGMGLGMDTDPDNIEIWRVEHSRTLQCSKGSQGYQYISSSPAHTPTHTHADQQLN